MMIIYISKSQLKKKKSNYTLVLTQPRLNMGEELPLM